MRREKVLSLKKHMEVQGQVEELLRCTLDSYRASLRAMGKCGTQAYPQVGQDLQDNLLALEQRLERDASADSVVDTAKNVEGQLEQWSLRASEYLKHKVAEAKEIMVVLARTAQAVSERDLRYGKQFNEITRRLEAIAELEDLSKIRSSLIENVDALRHGVMKMEDDSRRSVADLRAELAAYQSKLEEAEHLALRDELTGLSNRRQIERDLEQRVRQGKTFSILMFDLNGFKAINDAHGHLAGDQILKQFSGELRSFFQPNQPVGRWGGDEFIAILDCQIKGAQASLARARHWLFGDYKIDTPAGIRKVAVSGEIGLAEWTAGNRLDDVLARADAAMYRHKTAPAR